MSDPADPNQSPVVVPASPVGQGWQYMSATKKATLLVTVSIACFVGTMVLSGRWHAVHNTKPLPMPVSQDTVIDPLKLPPIQTQPKATPTSLPMPVAAPIVGPSNFIHPQQQQQPQGEDWSILAISSSPVGNGQSNNTNHPTEENGQQSELSARLSPTPLIGSRATELPNPDFLISQGRQIPCTQQSAINTSYVGTVSATIPVDIRGDTGHVVLLNAGSKIFGTIEKGITNGLDRVFVVWSRITTTPLYDGTGRPHEYAIQVNSPASDEVGATGLEGDVNRHILRKFGGVIALSLIQGGISALTAASQSSHSTNINLGNFTGSGDQLASQLLASTIQIPDVLTRPQGGSCNVFVARDLDFSGIYSLRTRR